MNLKVTYIGGHLSGHEQELNNRESVNDIGYNIFLETNPKGNEAIICYAVPNDWTEVEAHRAVMEDINKKNQKPLPGKKSV